jgi:hypothetical protein
MEAKFNRDSTGIICVDGDLKFGVACSVDNGVITIVGDGDLPARVRAFLAAGGTIEADESGVPTRQIEKTTIIARLTDDQLEAALGLMTTRQKELWRAPGYPAINVDDAELLAVLQAIGADAVTVLAAE